jgi:hypothetical protein
MPECEAAEPSFSTVWRESQQHAVLTSGPRRSRVTNHALPASRQFLCKFHFILVRKCEVERGFSDPFQATKYFAAGWCTTIAEVLCSGSSRNPVVRRTPTFSSG